MERNCPDRCVPKDWRFVFGLHLAVPATLILSASAALAATRVRQGDLTPFWVGLVCAAIGIGLLLGAKWPLYRQGKYLTFGPKDLPEGHRKVYWIAYAFVGIGLLIMLWLLVILR
jgi:hypothetical protein